MGFWFQPQFVMLCSWKGNQKLDGSSVLGVSKPLWCLLHRQQRGEEVSKYCHSQVVIFLLEYKRLLNTLDDRSIPWLYFSCYHPKRWGWSRTYVTFGMGNTFHISTFKFSTFSSQELSSEVRSGFKVSCTDSSTCLNLRLVWGMLSLLHLVFSLHSY